MSHFKVLILDALAEHELKALGGRVMMVMQDARLDTTQARVAAIVSAVAVTYGRRHEAHRLVMAQSLGRGGNHMAPLFARLRTHLGADRSSGAIRQALDPADAFFLAHAFHGVLLAMIREREDAPDQAEIERALTRIVLRFLGWVGLVGWPRSSVRRGINFAPGSLGATSVHQTPRKPYINYRFIPLQRTVRLAEVIQCIGFRERRYSVDQAGLWAGG